MSTGPTRPSPHELAEALWLSARLASGGGLGGGRRYPVPYDTGGRETEELLAEVWRPLRQLVRSRRRYELDEYATAEQASSGVWWPILTPVRQPRSDAVVVVDNHFSMTIWADQIAGLVGLLRRHDAVRDVRVCTLETMGDRPDQVALRGPDRRGLAPAPITLPAVARRRFVLVLSDGAAPAWHADAVLPHLHAWACRQPVAIIQLLPQQMWHRTGVHPFRAFLRAPSSGVANVRLDWRLPDLAEALPAAEDLRRAAAVPVPVLELRPRWLAAWVQLVAYHHPRWVGMPVLLATPRGAADRQPANRPGRRQPASSGRQGVLRFISWATPTALHLAILLAATPLDWQTIEVVREELLPESTTLHLAEVLTSDLVNPAADVDGTGRAGFEFVPGARQELLATGRRSETARVWRALASRLGATRPALAGLARVLDDPDAAPIGPVTPSTMSLLWIEQYVLQALSGRYLARARRLGDALTEADALSPERGKSGTPVFGQLNAMMAVGTDANTHREMDSGGGGVSPSTPAEATSARTPAVWGNIPPRNPNFTGREKLLALLYEQVQGGTTAVLPHALHGMGGVGKSHLAVEYVYQHQSEYDLVWWIPAERATQIGASLVELAQRMELPAGPDIASARAAVQEALRLGRPYARWLLIFDNAESPEALRPYLPTGGSGSIVITSRNPQWASMARTLEVDVFTREESIQLLRRRGPELDATQADRLAEALGDLPLALEQAAAWRAETGMPAEEYLRLFDEKRVELLEQAPPMDYQLPVAAAWNVSLDRLVVSNPAAFRLLQLCSFLAPEPIPRTLFNSVQNSDIHPELNAAIRDPMRLNRAIRDINRYALARVNHRTNSIQMHRLIQAVLLDRMTEPERDAMRQSAHLLLASGDRNDPDSPANWRSYADLYPHVIVSQAMHSAEPWVHQLVQNEAKYLYWWGDFEASLDLAQQAYDSWRNTLGEDASVTLAIGHWLGFMLSKLGRHREAAELNSRILESYERTTMEDTEELLRAVGAVAADLRIAGDFVKALETDEELYRRHVQALGEEDPSTLNAAHNLAVSLRLTGDIRRAFEVDKDTYSRRVLLFGEDHAHTLESHLNLIIDRRELGEYLPARAEMQNVVNRLPMVWGSAQTQTLLAKRRLASAMRKAGDHEAARAVSREVHDGFAARYGERHPDTLLAAFGLAVDLRATGDLEGAAQLSNEIVDRYRQLFDEEHPYTVAARLNTAIVHRLRGEVQLAREINEAGVEILTRRLSRDHPLTLAGWINLGNDHYVQREYETAFAADSDTVERARRVFGDSHPTTLICLGNLSMDHMALGRVAEAQELHADVTPKFWRALGENHPATIAGTDPKVRGDCDLDPMPL
ncbi:FxSxx-COOH system tetratricopeptide repeat protein [Plantactinospora sp. CA-294935]|uniref:FxSxx-COOH system tetratricopeptide repeat protein n=1 Tax=Plantactinospora sp. CA-294935 TaxID=3240012 RepID=UPI003D8DA746